MALQSDTRLASPENLRKVVILLAWPAIVEMVLHMAVGIVDTAMVGRLGAGALAAVGLAQQIFMLGTTVFAAIGTGATSLVARHTGAGEPGEAGRVARQSLLVGVFLAGSVLLVLVFFQTQILDFLFRSTDREVLRLSGLYVRIVALALIFQFFAIIINSCLRGIGDTKTPMQITGLVNCINVAGNYVLIFGIGPFPALGVVGAAAATALSQTVGGLLAVRALMRARNIEVSLTPPYRLDIDIVRRILRIGVPAALEQSAMRVGQLLYTMLVASLGTVAYAAHQVAINAESLSFMPGFGFSLAATTLVGQNLGAKKPDQAEKSGYIANQMAMIIMSAMGIVFFFFAEALVRFFTSDPEVVALGAQVLKVIAVSQPGLATVMVLAGGLRGAGDTKTILKITIAGFFVVRLTLAYLLAFVLGYGLVGAWVAMAVDLIVRGGLMRYYYGQGGWKALKV